MSEVVREPRRRRVCADKASVSIPFDDVRVREDGKVRLIQRDVRGVVEIFRHAERLSVDVSGGDRARQLRDRHLVVLSIVENQQKQPPTARRKDAIDVILLEGDGGLVENGAAVLDEASQVHHLPLIGT